MLLDINGVAGSLFTGPALIDTRHSDGVASTLIAWVRGLSAAPAGEVSELPKVAAAVPAYALEASDWQRYSVQNGIAYFPIQGILGWGWNDYQSLSLQFRTCLADPAVRGILFDINSPGGLVSKLFDFADEIHAARGVKLMWSLVNELATSAAYAIASATDRIIVPRTGEAGSVGVVMLHMSMAGALKEYGVEITPIFAGAHKVDGNWWSRLPVAVRERWELEIAESWDLFAGTVARNRGLKIEDVKATDALVYSGQHAVDIGFADAVMTAAEAAVEFGQHLSGQRPGSIALAATSPSSQAQEIDPMADTLTAPSGAAPRPAPAAAPVATPAAAPVATTGTEAAPAAAQTPAEAVAADRQRVAGIMALDEAKGREALAQHFALSTGMSVDEARSALAVSPQANAGGSLGLHMSTVDNPQVGAGGDGAEGAPDETAALAASIINAAGLTPRSQA